MLNLAKLRFEEWLTSCDEELFIKDMADEILDYNKNNNEKVKLLNSSDVTLGNFPKVDFVDNKDLKGHFKKRFQKTSPVMIISALTEIKKERFQIQKKTF